MEALKRKVKTGKKQSRDREDVNGGNSVTTTAFLEEKKRQKKIHKKEHFGREKKRVGTAC